MPARVRVDGVWVDVLFPTSGLKHSSAWRVDGPSGDDQMSVTVGCPENYQANWTQVGKEFEVVAPNGGVIRAGITSEPDRGPDGVTIHAFGKGHELKKWQAVYDADPGGGVDLQPSFVPNDAVDYAVSQGAPFGRFGVSLGTTPLSNSPDEPLTDLWTLLNRAAILLGKRVVVDAQGAITYQSDPTAVTWTTTPNAVYMGTADDTYVSRLYGYYLLDGAASWDVRLTGSPTGGTFTLTGNGATTGTIAQNASAATVQTAVRALGGVFALAVVAIPSGTSQRWVVTVTTGGVTLSGTGTALTGGTNPGVSVTQTRGDALVYAEDTGAAAKFGKKQASIDLRPLGAISTVAATAYINGRFALVGGRMGWTEGITLDLNNLMHITGAWANPRYVSAGQIVQLPDNRDARSQPTTRGSIRFLLSEVEVTEGPTPTAFAAPVGFSPRDFEGALAPPENPATKEAA